jgi:hypothetical protein
MFSGSRRDGGEKRRKMFPFAFYQKNKHLPFSLVVGSLLLHLPRTGLIFTTTSQQLG